MAQSFNSGCVVQAVSSVLQEKIPSKGGALVTACLAATAKSQARAVALAEKSPALS